MLKETLKFKINRIIKDETKTAKREYLQVYFDILDDDGVKIHDNGSFFVNSRRMNKWVERFGDLIESRDETRIKELEEELNRLRNERLKSEK